MSRRRMTSLRLRGRGERVARAAGVGADVADEPALLDILGKPHRSILRDDLKPEWIRFVLSLLVRRQFYVTQTGIETFGLLRTEVLEVVLDLELLDPGAIFVQIPQVGASILVHI